MVHGRKEEWQYQWRFTKKSGGVWRYTGMGSGRKNDVLTDEHLKFIDECLEEDKLAPKKQRHTAHRIFTRLCEEKGYRGCESAVRRWSQSAESA